jgi:Flp pilus assembly protein TadG
MKTMSNIWFRARRSALKLIGDCNAVAAIEFAMIVPIMLVMFFGTVEISSGVAVDRKVTLVARTLSDLTSQSPGSVADTNLTNSFYASGAIFTPYSLTPTNATFKISELYIEPTTLKATVQWSRSATMNAAGAVVLGAGRVAGTAVTIPSGLVVSGSYLIFSEVSYLYTPAVGYVMSKAGVTLSDVAYTRPRQSQCVVYPTPTTPGTPLTCVPI